MLSWFRRRRRARILAEPFPAEWLAHLERNVRHYGYLSAEEQARLRDWVQVFIAEKTWVGCGGLEVTDEVRVTIAAQAGILVLGIPHEFYFDNILSVLVYPTAFIKPHAWPNESGLVDPEQITMGEAWHRGPIVLSWQDALHGGNSPGNAQNLVFHEFAHQLDGIDGDTDGMPPLETRDQVRRWKEVTGLEYRRLVAASQRGQRTLLDWYGATNEAEFFAVATECFFEQPRRMARQHPELYDVMRRFFRQDPQSWHTGAEQAPQAPPAIEKRHKKKKSPHDGAAATADSTRIDPHSADGAFTRGVLHLNRGRLRPALDEFDEALRIDPDDAEARWHRAEVLIDLGRPDEALADCEEAIRLDPTDNEAYRIRGRALAHLERFEAALADFNRVLQSDQRNTDVFFERGMARAGLGHHQDAVIDYTRALRANPDWADAYLARSQSYEALGEVEKAQADRRQAERHDPSLAADAP